jgi:hypothetical protein
MSTTPNPAGVEVISDPSRPAPPNYRPTGLPQGPLPDLLFTPIAGFKTPNGEPMNWQYIHDHHRPTRIPGWLREVTAILNNVIVHAEVCRNPSHVPRPGEIEPLLITGRYYGLNGLREVPLL